MPKNSFFSRPRGTLDVFPPESAVWAELEDRARSLFRLYGYQEIRTPYFEETALFARSMGQTSDVVRKQMLTLRPQGDETKRDSSKEWALRPEATASVVRAYIENHTDKRERVTKWFYAGAMFRGERPQKGRLRQFTQMGVERIGPKTRSPYADAEIVQLAVETVRALGVRDFEVKINSLGSAEDKAVFSRQLREAIRPYRAQMGKELAQRYDENVFRVLDAKDAVSREIVKNLSLTGEHLSDSSRDYFETVCALVEETGIVVKRVPSLVRGLDYYTHTVFEITTSRLGSQDALGAGGRYDELVSLLGGPEADAVGFALGLERMLLAREEAPGKPFGPTTTVWFLPLDEESVVWAWQGLCRLRQKAAEEQEGKPMWAFDMAFPADSLKSRLRQAHKRGVRFVVLAGPEEKKRGVVVVKDMDSKQAEGGQQDIPVRDEDWSEVSEYFKERCERLC